MPIHQNDFITYLTAESLDCLGIKHGFFARHGGCSPEPWNSLNLATSVGDSRENVLENRKRLFASLQINEDCIFDVWQVHSNKVIITDIPRAIGEPHKKADAIISNQTNLSLLMLFADCVPLLFYDPEHKVIGIAHAGWKGTINKIVLSVVEKMQTNFQSNPEQIISVIGPCICVRHYKVKDDVAIKAKNAFYKYQDVVLYQEEGNFLNLRLANEYLLKEAGINHIENIEICTACSTHDWFSHRAEHGKTGRFGTVITIRG